MEIKLIVNSSAITDSEFLERITHKIEIELKEVEKFAEARQKSGKF